MRPPLLLLVNSLALAALLGAGCGLFNTVPAGTVSGLVLFNGEPAAGKQVSLINSGLANRVTGQDGRYTFTGVPAGTSVYVHYLSNGDRANAVPNEIASWSSQPLDGSSGANVPAFDVAYNGLLSPDTSSSLIVTPTSPVPFYWSPSVNAKTYRLWLKDDASNGAAFKWSSEWAGAATAIFAKNVAPGTYDWYVEIDGGDGGTGFTRSRKVDLGPAPDAAPAGS